MASVPQYRVRIMAYGTHYNVIDGVVVTFTDVPSHAIGSGLEKSRRWREGGLRSGYGGPGEMAMNQSNTGKTASALRRKAEESLAQRPQEPPTSEGDLQSLLHELQVHQIELEMQNEELRAAKMEIDAVKARYFDLYDQAPVGYCMISEAGLILEANLTAAALLGTTRSALVKQPISRSILKEDQDIFCLHRRKLVETGEPQECDLRLVKPDGALFWAHLTSSAAQEEGGAPASRVAISNIMERKLSDLQLQRAEETHRALIAALPDVVMQFDAEGRHLFASDNVVAVTGIPAADFIGKTHAELAFPVDLCELWEHAIHQPFASGAPHEIDFTIEGPAGQIIYNWRLSPEFDEQGAVRSVLAVARNITEQRLAEAGLRESESAFRKVLEASTSAVLLQDSTAAFVDCNQAALDLLKMTREQFIHMTPDQISVEFQPNGRRSGEYAPEMTALGWKGFHRFEWTCRDLEGGEFIVEVTLVPITLKGQKMLHCAWRDITERKRAEEQIRLLAFYDPLTQLPNRRLLHDRLNLTMAASKRNACYGCVMFLDLDNFKPLNDLHGHFVGDMLLINAAARLKSSVREIDTVARLAGDEFVLVISELNADQAESADQAGRIAEKLRANLAEPYQIRIPHEGASECIVEHQCTASIGVTLFLGQEVSPTDILKQVDAAMYQAKEAGGNQVSFRRIDG